MRVVGIECKDDFLLGSLLPDIPWLPLMETIDTDERLTLHAAEKYDRCSGKIVNINGWISRYRSKMLKYDLYKGALTHIVLDNELSTSYQLIHDRISKGNVEVIWPGGDAALLDADDFAHSKWQSLETYSLAKFGRQDDWLLERSSWITHEAAEELETEFGLGSCYMDDLVMRILDRLPKDIPAGYKETSVPKFYDAIHANVLARCVMYLSLI